jgi:hypothetical protein
MPKRGGDGQTKRFEFRTGFGGFKWGGMYTQGDPGACPPNKLRLLVNARIRNGELKPRASWNPLYTTPTFGDCTIDITDHKCKPVRLWFAVNGCPGALGGSVLSYSPEQEPELQVWCKYFATADHSVYLASFDGDVWIGENNKLRRLQVFPLVYREFGGDLSGGQDLIVREFEGFNISCLGVFEGKLYIGLDAGAGASKIVEYDGTAFRDDVTGIDPPLAMAVWRQNLAVGFSPATNELHLRASGASPGSYSTITPGAGTVSAYQSGNSMLSHRDRLYIADGDVNLWKYDGSTLAIERSPTNATSVRAVAEFYGHLYYGYNTASAAIIGKHDQISNVFLDTHKNITTQFTFDTVLHSLCPYRGLLIVGMSGVALSGGNYVSQAFVSPGADTASDWFGVGSESPGPSTFPATINFLVH